MISGSHCGRSLSSSRRSCGTPVDGRYSGRWTQAGYEERAARLQRAITDAGLRAIGQPRWARFDPPWTSWCLRRNEVVVPVAAPDPL
ncbi:MAG: heme-binding protein [Dermatophilaceae bacterium]